MRQIRVDLNEFVIRHDGVVSARQARGFLSTSAIGRRLSSGVWTAVTPGVYLVAGHQRSARAQARIAALSVGDDAVLGGEAAAWWLDIVDKPPRKHLVYTATRGRYARASSTTVVRQRHLDPHDISVVDDLPVTAREASVLDAALTLGISVVDSALLRGFVTLPGLEAAHQRYPGRQGIANINRFLALLRSGARSEAERVVVRMFRRAHVTGWIANHPVGGYLIDFAFPDINLAIEIDGFGWHRDVGAFQHDRTRRNALVAAGWTVLNYTWADLLERPSETLGEIATVRHQLTAA